MPIEDDAWGTPVPESTEAPAEAAPPPPPPPAAPPRSPAARPTWLRPPVIGGVVAVIVVIVVVVIVAGGGGSSGTGLSKAAWIQKADAFCGQSFPQQSADASSGNIAGQASLAQNTLTKIKSLGLPSEGADQVKSYEALEQRGMNALEAAVGNANSDPSTAQSDLQQAQSIFQTGATDAGNFGMQVCNSGQ